MKSILFSSERALALNKKISEEIGEHIVLCCHYNPEINMVFSSDAKYYVGILNLYKFLIDCGIAGKLSSLRKYALVTERYKNNKDLVCLLRAVHAHNKNEQNDFEGMLNRYKAWLVMQIGKDNISEIGDYDILFEKIESLGEELYDDISLFIDTLAKSTEKDKIIDEIENLWIQYYKNSSGREIILTQMWNMYMTSHGISYENISLKERENKLKRWCRELYCGKNEAELESLNKALDMYGKRLKPADLQKLKDTIKVKEDELVVVEEAAKESKGYLNLYIQSLNEEKIPCEILVIKADKGRSIRPEDMLQSILEKDFGSTKSR